MERKKKVSMKLIAEKLNVSPGTVSLTLNGRGDELRISEETQKMIVETAKKMGYPLERVRKNRQTIGVNNLPVVVLFMPILNDGIISPYDRIMAGLHQCMKEKEICVEILVCPFQYNHLKEKYRYFASKFCTGAIIFSVSENDIQDLMLQDFDIPVVLFNRLNEKYPTVYIDDYDIGYNVAKMFHEKGCKKTAMFTPDYRNKPILMRKMGFEAGCDDYGIELPENYNQVCRLDSGEIEQCIEKMYEKKQIPDMFFSNMDDLGLRIIIALKEKGVRIPEETEVVSYGDHAWTKAIASAMTCIHLDIEGMSGACLQLLWDMIHSGDWTPAAIIFQKQSIF